jgi:hypothetical protein
MHVRVDHAGITIHMRVDEMSGHHILQSETRVMHLPAMNGRGAAPVGVARGLE